MESTDSSSGSQQQPQLPPGFRFHPTDEELVVHYLKKKAASAPLPVTIIAEVDLYKFDPWELPEKAVFGEREWYFFSPRDRKYPNWARPIRAAISGYWKATGTDKAVLTAGGTQKVGVKKALVFYAGKPPKGIKTNWIMHEYRLADNKPTSKPPGCDFANKKPSLRLDDWVLCRIYKKNNTQRPVDQERHDHVNAMIGSSMAVGQHKFLENDQNLYQGIVNDAIYINSHLGSSGSKAIAPQVHRTLPNLYWNHQRNANSSSSTKRFLDENIDGRTDETSTNSMATILSQLPQTPSMLPNLGDGVFEQQTYQFTGMNWYSN